MKVFKANKKSHFYTGKIVQWQILILKTTYLFIASAIFIMLIYLLLNKG